MIKYNTIQNKYLYNKEDIDRILELIQDGNYYNDDYCTQENVLALIKLVNDFMEHITIVSENVVTERHETEDEAREYFGEDFIKRFDQILTMLDRQETIVAIHGTREEVCPMICENGLQYKFPSLSSTAVQQCMAYGQHEIHYDDYESLLNWGHRNYKGLVILAIPYECYYKEGLWKKFQETNSSMYGGQDYRIDPDFIFGYIDVTKKQIIVNPKYNRQHNYEGYVKDMELFREQLDMDNNKIKQSIIEYNAQIEHKLSQYKEKLQNEDSMEKQIDFSRIPYIIEELIGTFNSIKNGFPNGMSEERYKYFLEELSYGYNDICKVVPLLKTNEQVQKEQEEKYSMFNDTSQVLSSIDQASDFGEFDWGDDFDWETQIESPKKGK